MTNFIISPSPLRQFQLKVTEGYMLLGDMNKNDLLTAMKLVLNLIEKVGELLHGQESGEITQSLFRENHEGTAISKTKPSSTLGSPTESNSLFRKRKNPLPSKYGPLTSIHINSPVFQKPSSSIMSKYRMLSTRLCLENAGGSCDGLGEEDMALNQDDTQVPDSRSQEESGAGQQKGMELLNHDQEDALDYRTTDDKGVSKSEENRSPQEHNDAHDDSFSDHENTAASPVEHPDSPVTIEYSNYPHPSEGIQQLNDQPVFPGKAYVPTSPGPDYHPSQDLRASVAVSLVPNTTTSGYPHSINSITGALGIRPSTYPYSQNSFVPLKLEQHSATSTGMNYDSYYELPKPLPPMKHEYQEDGRVHYKCGFCKKVIAFSELFHKHLKSHVTKTANKCDLCNINFAFRSNLFRHIRRYHIEYVCAMCSAVCPRPKQLEQHLHVHHSEMNAVVREVSLR